MVVEPRVHDYRAMTHTSNLPPAASAIVTPRPLVRSVDDRMLAGVSGGIAGRLGVDAVIIRVLTVVLSLFGGAGVLLYALGWLLLPAGDGRGRSELEDAFDARTKERGRHLLIVLGLVLAIGISSLVVFSSSAVPGLLVVLTAVTLLLLDRRDPGRASGPYGQAGVGPAQSSRVGAGQPTTVPYASQGPESSQRVADPASRSTWHGQQSTVPGTENPLGATSPTTGQAPIGAEATSVLHPSAEPTTTLDARVTPTAELSSSAATLAGESPMGSGAPPPVPPQVGRPDFVGPPRPPPPLPRDRSHLGLLTASVALLALGALALADLAALEVPGGAYVALALAVVALGLLIGAWFGRSRGLIVLGVVLSAALVPAVVVDTATDGDWSELRRWGRTETAYFTPGSTAEIAPAYEIGSGRFALDLRGLDFSGEAVSTEVDAGAGEVLILVPANVDVAVSAALGVGELVLFDYTSGGIRLSRALTEVGADGVGGGELDLTVAANIGRVEVFREAA